MIVYKIFIVILTRIITQKSPRNNFNLEDVIYSRDTSENSTISIKSLQNFTFNYKKPEFLDAIEKIGEVNKNFKEINISSCSGTDILKIFEKCSKCACNNPINIKISKSIVCSKDLEKLTKYLKDIKISSFHIEKLTLRIENMTESILEPFLLNKSALNELIIENTEVTLKDAQIISKILQEKSIFLKKISLNNISTKEDVLHEIKGGISKNFNLETINIELNGSFSNIGEYATGLYSTNNSLINIDIWYITNESREKNMSNQRRLVTYSLNIDLKGTMTIYYYKLNLSYILVILEKIIKNKKSINIKKDGKPINIKSKRPKIKGIVLKNEIIYSDLENQDQKQKFLDLVDKLKKSVDLPRALLDEYTKIKENEHNKIKAKIQN